MEKEKKSGAIPKTFDRRGTERFQCPRGWFLSTMPRNKSRKRTHARAFARDTRWAVCRSFESRNWDGIHFRRVGSHARRPLFVNRAVSRSRNSNETRCGGREASGVWIPQFQPPAYLRLREIEEIPTGCRVQPQQSSRDQKDDARQRIVVDLVNNGSLSERRPQSISGI